MYSDPVRLRISDVERRLAIHRQSIWRWVRDGILPAPVMVGPNSKLFRASQILEHEANLSQEHCSGQDGK